MQTTSCFCNKLRRSTRVLSKLYDDALAPAALTVSQFVLLRNLERLGEASISELAEAAVLERSGLGRTIRAMEQQGWVALEPGDDQRQQIIRLTVSGKKKLAKAVPLWQQVQDQLAKQFSSEQRAQLFALLDQIEALHDVTTTS